MTFAYFQAMSYFANGAFKANINLQFLVVSEDRQWALENILLPTSFHAPPHRINITHVTRNDAARDLAVMAACDHVIMSTGTFGWWAGWLANGTTVYYSDWPRNGSVLDKKFTREDFFPPTWIGMNGAGFE